MFITRNDFRIESRNFDFSQPMNVLRIMAGACFIPHALSKFAAGGLSAGTVAFFAKAGLQPAEFFVLLAAASEIIVGVALVLGICTRWAGFAAAAVLATAIYALTVVKGFGWTWNTGGNEYNVFWAVTCVLISIDAWKAYAKNAMAGVPRGRLQAA